MPILPGFLAANPELRLDIIVDDSLIDIVAARIDAGIRFGDIVEKDMIAVRISPDRSCVAQALIVLDREPVLPRRFLAGADAVATAEQKIATLQKQIDAYRALSSALAIDG